MEKCIVQTKKKETVQVNYQNCPVDVHTSNASSLRYYNIIEFCDVYVDYNNKIDSIK